jgi:diguanylate cyclase (GGDEF)-like protein
MISVIDMMSSPVVTVRLETTVSEVIRQIMKGPYSGLPVVDDGDKVVGIITELDVLKALEEGREFSDTMASEIMTRDPITADVNASLFEVLKTLIDKHIIRLPVTEDGRLVGIVARRDILRSISDGMSDTEDLSFLNYTIRALLSAKTHREMVKVLVERMGDYFEAGKCSVIRVKEDKGIAFVLSSYEDTDISDLRIDLSKYPEIMKTCRTGQPVVLNNALEDPLMRPVRHMLKDVNVRSVLVFPIISKDEVLGTIYLRTQKERQFSRKETKVAEVLASMASDALKAISREQKMRERYEEAERKVVLDDLTGLYNRRFFNVRLAEEFNMAVRHGLPLSCVMFDIDHFKSVNDTLGHDAGDSVLKTFAAQLKKMVRLSDVVARYAGDEFLLLLPMTDEKGALIEVGRIKDSLDKLQYDPPVGHLRVSIGVAALPLPGGGRPEDLIRNADLAMYEAKKGGRNRINAYESLQKLRYVSTK